MAPVSAALYIPTIVFNFVFMYFLSLYFLFLFFLFSFLLLFLSFSVVLSLFDYFIHFSFIFDFNGLVFMI